MASKCQQKDIPFWQLNMIHQSKLILRELVLWIRFYLISAYANVGDKEEVYNKLARIPSEFGNIIRLFFGDTIADTYTGLFGLQILLIRNLIDNQIKRDTKGVSDTIAQLYEVSEKRAIYLGQLNKYWNQKELNSLTYTFLSYVIEETTEFLIKDYKGSIEAFDKLSDHADDIGIFFAEGLYQYLTEPSNKI